MKELTNLQVKSFKKNLIKFKNDSIKKIKLIAELRKGLIIIMKEISLRVLKTSDIYLMKKKMSLYMKISRICLVKKMSLQMNLHLNQ